LEGDLYGSGHSQPKRNDLGFSIRFGLPWVQVVFTNYGRNKKTFEKRLVFFFLWLFGLPIFLRFLKNILHTYTLPITMPIMF
jgi:hypothetical protein